MVEEFAAHDWLHQAQTRHHQPKRGTIITLHDTHIYMLALKGGRERREHWQRAAALLMEAADCGDLEAAARQIELALIMDGALGD
jgi:hypothetical protein